MDAPDADVADAVAVVVANEVPGTLAVVEAIVPDVVLVVVADEVLVTLVDCTSVGCAVGDGVGTRVTARPRHGTVPWGQTKLSTSEYATHVLIPGSG